MFREKTKTPAPRRVLDQYSPCFFFFYFHWFKLSVNFNGFLRVWNDCRTARYSACAAENPEFSQLLQPSKMPIKFSAAVRLQQEQMYRQAFRYFDRDQDGLIGEKTLLQVHFTKIPDTCRITCPGRMWLNAPVRSCDTSFIPLVWFLFPDSCSIRLVKLLQLTTWKKLWSVLHQAR